MKLLALLSALMIVIRSIWQTFWVSTRILALAYSGRQTRARIDRLTRQWAHNLLKYVKLKFRVINPEGCHYPPGRCIILMCNHSSLYDIPLAISALPGSIRMLAKRELFQVPIWGAAMSKAEFVSVDRKNSAQAIKDLQLAKAKMQDGVILWISPEGTRSDTGKLLRFKKGGFILAIQTGAIIIPVGIRGANNVLPARTLQFNLNQQVELHIGQPVDAATYTLESRELLMEKVRQSLLTLADLRAH